MRITDSIRRRNAHKWEAAVPYRTQDGVVVSYAALGGISPRSHESVTRMEIAKRLARLKGYEFGGEYDGVRPSTGAVYFVPSHTLVGLDTADALGIHGEDDLFGGVVPYPFVGTKTITHPLDEAGAAAPEGWSQAFAIAVEDAVLAGYSAFSAHDASRAGARLLEGGPVRVKPALAIGGRGQTVVRDRSTLESAIAALDPQALSTYGVVLEQNLTEVTTYSVGQVRVAELVATYYGTQKLTRDNKGAEVYGGSELTVVRGDFDNLLERDMDAETRNAVEEARVYDSAARRCFPGFFASRCNYDIARGRDTDGQRVSGVLEQSWRIGGASGPEIAALEAFRGDRNLDVVRAAGTEVYGDSPAPPRDAIVYFRGVDEEVGLLTKYTVVEPHGDA